MLNHARKCSSDAISILSLWLSYLKTIFKSCFPCVIFSWYTFFFFLNQNGYHAAIWGFCNWDALVLARARKELKLQMVFCFLSQFGGGLGVETAQLSVLFFPSLGLNAGHWVSQNNLDPVDKCLGELVWNTGFSGSEGNFPGQMSCSSGWKRGARPPSKLNVH